MSALTSSVRGNADFMATCYHEAGHVVWGWLYGCKIQIARAIRETNGGEVFFDQPKTRRQRISMAHAAAGGPCAEAYYHFLAGRGGNPSFDQCCLWSSEDFRLLAFDESVAGSINIYSFKAEELLKRADVRAALSFISGILYGKEVIAGDEVKGLMKHLIPVKWPTIPCLA